MKKKIFIISIASILFVGLVVGIYYAYSIHSFVNEIYKPPESEEDLTIDAMAEQENDESPDEFVLDWGGDDRVNILFIGADARGLKTSPLTDTLILASISPVDKEVILFSILRDTYVEIQEGNWNRINAANPIGGAELTMETVSDLTGLDVSHYFYTDFEGFVQLIDTLGGIEIDVEQDMYKKVDMADEPPYNFIDLKKGLQTLSGIEALQYVRFRSDGQSDFGRTERQRKFLTVLAGELNSAMSIVKLPQILESLAKHLETNVTPSEQWQLARFGLQSNFQSINSVQIPPPGLFEPIRNEHGEEVLKIEKQNIRDFIEDQLP